MKRHLTERELIEYQFKLASDVRMEQKAEHLDKCARCREHLERLAKKFAALNLLRGEEKVSEDLISQVIEQASHPTRTGIVPFRKRPWISAAAAVLLVGLLLLADHLGQERTKQSEVTKEPAPAVEKIKVEKQMYSYFQDAEKEAVTLGESKEVAIVAADSAVIARPEVAIPEQPPFAPASAIELVTLPRRDKVQLTIYNSADLTLVRERRNLTLKKGWNWLQFMWANTLIDPTSLSLEPMAQADKIDIQQLVFPARLTEIGRWLIRSELSGQVPFEITYFTSGLSWRAFYMGTLSQDEKTMRLQGYVRVSNNSGEDYEQAQTRLIVGQVHLLDEIAELARRRYPYGRPGVLIPLPEEPLSEQVTDYKRDLDQIRGRLDELIRKPKEITKEGLSEYFLYTIEGTETIPNEWGKRLISFEAEDITVQSLYKYDQQRWGDQTTRFVKFKNDQDHNLGQTPIPNGDVKIYSQADSAGLLSYIGGTSIKYIPVNEEVELNLGSARLVKVEPTLMDFKIDNCMFDRRNNITGWDEIRTWKIEITNTRTLPIEVEITRGFDTAYWTMQFSDEEVTYEKHDATHGRFKVNLGPRSKYSFAYTVTTYHGTREESLAK